MSRLYRIFPHGTVLLLGAALLLANFSIFGHVTAGEPTDKSIDPALFKRDQPTLLRVGEWDGRVVVEADRFYTLDLDRATAKPLELPGVEEIVGVATGERGKPFALCKTKGGHSLLVKEKDKWIEQELPDEVRKSRKPPRLTADAASVALLAEDKVYRLAAKKWTTISLTPRPEHLCMMHDARHVLLAGERMYLGYDSGEWGGGLLRLDLGTGKWEEIKLDDGHTPVHDLKSGPGGKVWTVEGLDHLGLMDGVVHSYDGKAWKMLCRSSKGDPENWDLPSASLAALAFDVKGNLWLLSGWLGLIRREKEKWVRVTPGWHDCQPVQSLHMTSSGVAVIGTLDAGVLLFEVESKRIRRVTLGK